MLESGDEERVIYWPSNEPFVNAVVENITPSSYKRGWFCMNFIVYNNDIQRFEPIKLHVPGYIANGYKIGDMYSAHFKNIGSTR